MAHSVKFKVQSSEFEVWNAPEINQETWNLELVNLNLIDLPAELFSFKDCHGLDVSGVGEQVHGLHAKQAISFHKHCQISGQSCGIA